ncbi:MAG: TIGR02466 family protein [Pseudomonadota bacterium]
MNDISLDLRFSSPICQLPISGFAEKKDDLIAYVLSLRESTEGIQSSNYNGWHSHRKIHLDENPVIQWMVRRISHGTVKGMQKMFGEEQNINVQLRECWANINASGTWNMPHTHPVFWSGVVYIDAEVKDEARKDKPFRDGDTIFFNPVSEAKLFGQPAQTAYHPEDGMMLLFPGYLAHMVAPHSDDKDRITLAFNIERTTPPKQNPEG